MYQNDSNHRRLLIVLFFGCSLHLGWCDSTSSTSVTEGGAVVVPLRLTYSKHKLVFTPTDKAVIPFVLHPIGIVVGLSYFSIKKTIDFLSGDAKDKRRLIFGEIQYSPVLYGKRFLTKWHFEVFQKQYGDRFDLQLIKIPIACKFRELKEFDGNKKLEGIDIDLLFDKAVHIKDHFPKNTVEESGHNVSGTIGVGLGGFVPVGSAGKASADAKIAYMSKTAAPRHKEFVKIASLAESIRELEWGKVPDQLPPALQTARRSARRRFAKIHMTLKTQGVDVVDPSDIARIAVSKGKLTKDDLKLLGFEPVVIAIPEKGQKTFQSYRHPSSNHHVHDHGDEWVIHEDEHSSTTMLWRKSNLQREGKSIQAPHRLKKLKSIDEKPLSKIKATVQGMKHVITEGVPGMVGYIKGQITGVPDMSDRLNAALP